MEIIIESLKETFYVPGWDLSMWIAQIFGIIAVIAFVISYLQKDHQITLYFQFLGSACWIVNFIFLHAWAGVILNIIGLVRTTIFILRIKYPWASSWKWYPIFIAAFIVGGVASFFMTDKESGLRWTSFLLICAFTLTTISLSLKSTFKIRILTIVTTPFWIAYDLLWINGSGLLNDAITLVSTTIGLIAIDLVLHIKKNKELKTKNESNN